MFTVYAEKDIFENIVVFNDQAPHWFNIFCMKNKIQKRNQHQKRKNGKYRRKQIE